MKWSDEQWCRAAGIGALALLALMIVISPSKDCYDEVFYLDFAKSVRAIGWRAALTAPDNLSPVGPLYPAVHLAAAPLTRLSPPAVRWLNYSFLALVIAAVAKSAEGTIGKKGGLAGLSILAVPFLWPSAGMALTELPALAAFSVFVLAMLRLHRVPPETISASSLGWVGLAGISLGLAILGRQTYLITVPAVAAMFVVAPRKWIFWLGSLAIAIGSSVWLFLLWGGITPPSLPQVNAGINFGNGVLSLSTFAAATLFLRPDWVKPASRLTLIASVVLGIGLALVSRDYAHPPGKTLLFRVVGESLGRFIGFSFGVLLAVMGVLWLWNTVRIAARERRNPDRVFLFLTLFALVAAPMKISHQFSSRYVVGALGLLILVTASNRTPSRTLALRILMGSGTGAMLLYVYYQQ